VTALARILEEFSAQRIAAPARLAAAQALREHSLPTRHDENWHYANLRAIEGVPQFRPGGAPALQAAPLSLPAALPGFERLVFIDGRLHPKGCTPAALRLAGPQQESSADAAGAFEAAGDGRLGLIARMFAPEPRTLRISGTMALELIFVSTAAGGASYSDLSLELAAGATLELVERSVDIPGGTAGETGEFCCSTLQLRLAGGAHLVHTRLLHGHERTLRYDTLSATVAERASYQFRHLSTGGANARSSVQVQLLGREAVADIRALAVAQSTHQADALYTVLHEAPGSRSNLVFRGIASERAHVACSADVQVSPEAAGARVLQSLRGLIDGKGAEVNLRPRLTINTDDIQAAHGATTGRLDEDLLFYLLSRGLAPAAARSLLKWAFLSETLGVVGPAALRKAAEWAVASGLSDAPAPELLQ
jgi:Fe-S cluster assembly protein SufD